MESQKVTKDMTIGEVVNKYPESSTIMLSYGLHCVGCAVNPYESIENGCLGHGIDENTINKLVHEINKKLENKEERISKKITITKNAADKFKEFMKEENKENCAIKLQVIDTGSTLQYTLDFTDHQSKNEEEFEENGIKIFVEKSQIELIKGTQIDYIENERGSGFKIENLNQNSGGCGTGCGCH